VEPRRVVKAAQPTEERLVADETPQHVKHRRALVVDERAKDAALIADVSEPVSEVDRTLIRVVHAPLAQLPQHGGKNVVALLLLRVERREVLREALAEPLLVVVAPADRLPPPLVRELVGEEEVGKTAERGRVVAPDQRRRGKRLIERREVAGTVSRQAGRFPPARS
jgi:hypothetical protein